MNMHEQQPIRTGSRVADALQVAGGFFPPLSLHLQGQIEGRIGKVEWERQREGVFYSNTVQGGKEGWLS